MGVDISADELSQFNATVLCVGATKPRDLPIPGRTLTGVHFAWDFLSQQNKRISDEAQSLDNSTLISANGKDVIVIGGGDTGSDCVGTSNRQHAKSITQFELLPMPPTARPEHQPWPYYP